MQGERPCLTTEEGLELMDGTLSFVPNVDNPFMLGTTPHCVVLFDVGYAPAEGRKLMPADIQDLKDWIDLKCWCLPAIEEFWHELEVYQKFNSPKMICWWRREILTHAYNQIREVMIVAKRQSKEETPSDEIVWTFVQCELEEEEIEAAIGQFSDGGVLWDMAVETMQEGYKLSITYDEKSDSFCASLTGKNCPKPNVGKTITGWYDDPSSALAVVLYKHAVKLEGIWQNPTEGKKRRG